AVALRQRLVGADRDDAASGRGDAALELAAVRDDARAADDEVGLHCSSLIASIRRRIPRHWLAPTVTGARLPRPRAQIPLRPKSRTASRSTPPGGAARSITTDPGTMRSSTS